VKSGQDQGLHPASCMEGAFYALDRMLGGAVALSLSSRTGHVAPLVEFQRGSKTTIGKT
jgi:hypothetical protein